MATPTNQSNQTTNEKIASRCRAFFFFDVRQLSFCAALLVPIYRQKWCHQLQLIFNNGGSTWIAPFCQWLVQLPL
jgi:hypothetical protein